jgi:ribulose-phosphate 3-epimerase
VPAILTDNVEHLRSTLTQAEEFTDYVQIDFMDGRFVPSKSVSPKEINGIGTTLTCEAHIMVKKPGQYLRDLKSFGFRRIIFHYEADSHPRALIRRIKEQGMEAGMAINPETDISGLHDFVPELDAVLFLSVNPGFYGSAFIPTVLDKIRSFREVHSSIVIGIDGGVELDNLSRIQASGVNYACVGSRIFLSDAPAKSYEELERKLMAR